MASPVRPDSYQGKQDAAQGSGEARLSVPSPSHEATAFEAPEGAGAVHPRVPLEAANDPDAELRSRASREASPGEAQSSSSSRDPGEAQARAAATPSQGTPAPGAQLQHDASSRGGEASASGAAAVLEHWAKNLADPAKMALVSQHQLQT